MQYQVVKMVGTERTVYPPVTETEARADAINQSGSLLADAERDGFAIRRLQAVLDHPDGRVLVIEIDPV